MRKMALVCSLVLMFVGCGKGVSQLSHTGICDGYGDWSTSLYNVPWSVGVARIVSQGNCGAASHFGTLRYAYDIGMDIGSQIVASRAGTVIKVVENFEDGNGCPDANLVQIQHSDGTVAEYVHLTHNGVQVNVGAAVNQGDPIALSGNTGCSSGPHLHFQVFTDNKFTDTMPLNFKNTSSNGRGLQEGKTYTAQ